MISVWLGFFALIPYLFILAKSVSQPLTTTLLPFISLRHYQQILFNPLYLKVFFRSFLLSTTCTSICLCIAYPFTYFLSTVKTPYKSLLIFLLIIPFWTSSLIRTYAIIALLKTKGIINNSLIMVGFIKSPLQLLHTHTAVIIGLVYDLLPFMIFPLYTNFEKLDRLYIDAAKDLGASGMMIFRKVIIPLTMPGIISGSMLVFLPAMTLFYIPDLLGGAKSLFLGNLIQRQFLANNWPLGSALSSVLILSVLFLLFVAQRIQKTKNFYQKLF